MSDTEDWRGGALCLQIGDPELFFPEPGESNLPAKRVCARCDVRTQCLDFALDNGIKFGVYGGLAAGERGRLLRDLRHETEQQVSA